MKRINAPRMVVRCVAAAGCCLVFLGPMGCSGSGSLEIGPDGVHLDLWRDAETGELLVSDFGRPRPTCDLVGSVLLVAEDD